MSGVPVEDRPGRFGRWRRRGLALHESGLPGAGTGAPRALVRARGDGYRRRRRGAGFATGEERPGSRRGRSVWAYPATVVGPRAYGREIRAEFFGWAGREQ